MCLRNKLNMFTFTHVHPIPSFWMCTHKRTHTHTHTDIYTGTHMYIHACTHVHAHTHAHTHTLARSLSLSLSLYHWIQYTEKAFKVRSYILFIHRLRFCEAAREKIGTALLFSLHNCFQLPLAFITRTILKCLKILLDVKRSYQPV